LKTISIGPGGDIAPDVLDTFEFDPNECYLPDIIAVTEGVFAVAYSGPSIRGYIKTIGIASGETPPASYEIISAAAGHSIRAYINVSDAAASIISWEIQ
jgi:hypothetical protein